MSVVFRILTVGFAVVSFAGLVIGEPTAIDYLIAAGVFFVVSKVVM